MNNKKPVKTLNILTAALGGEGGGVFTEWLNEVALLNGWISQSTYLAGVAQRTGATIYYTEMIPRRQAPTVWPVMSLFPNQGDIDIAITSEIAEAGRMLQRGFISPERTTLISSTHRVYGITEKINLLNGMIDDQKLLALGERCAKDFICFDMQAIASANNAVISASLLGALAGAYTLPFSQESFIDVIEASGRAVPQNLGAFHDSYDKASGVTPVDAGQAEDDVVQTFIPEAWKLKTKEDAHQFELPSATSAKGQVLLERLNHSLPVSTHHTIYQGLAKTLEYQNYKYAGEYLEELIGVIHSDKNDSSYELTNKVARYLALWMCYEDIPRVAQLKTRPTRTAEISREMHIKERQVMRTIEYFRPRAEEICAMLPAWIGNPLLNSKRGRSMLESIFGGDRKLRTDRIGVYLLMRMLAFMRRLRRISSRFKHEKKMIHNWLKAVKEAAQTSQELALATAECARLVKGYGYTRERTASQLTAIVELILTHKVSDSDLIHKLMEAALADDQNEAFTEQLSRYS